jgi:Flp pilus assembly protein TadG
MTGGRRGSHALEFALLMPAFWMLLAGALDWGWLYYHQAMLDTAAYAGCRAGSLVDPGQADQDLTYVQQIAQESMQTALAANPGTKCDAGVCTLTVTTGGAAPGRTLDCDVTRQFDPLIGFAVAPMRLHAQSVVRMEWQRWPK